MHIHILGIVGVKTAPLAIILKKLGNTVTGSDQEKVYPPFSTQLAKHKIKINQTPISRNIDLVIVGNSFASFQKCQDEFDQIKKLKIPFISYTDYIVKNLIKPQSILVAGSYGKTTISSLLSYVFTQLKIDASYMFGGFIKNKLEPTHFGQSNFSIIESDENHNGLDTSPTFLYYPCKYLILTSTLWEHKESFANAKANLEAYQQLVAKIPASGVLVYNASDPNIKKILPFCKSQAIPYQANTFVKSNLIGQHNQENISAILTLCDFLQLPTKKVLNSISRFKGVKRRLEIFSQTNNILIIDDFAQSATRVKSALTAVSETYPHRRIFVLFEPHATFLQYKQSLSEFTTVFEKAHQVIISRVSYSKNLDKNQRTTPADWKNINTNLITYIPIDIDIVSYFAKNLQPNDILIHFSSGGLDGLRTLKSIKKTILDIHL